MRLDAQTIEQIVRSVLDQLQPPTVPAAAPAKLVPPPSAQAATSVTQTAPRVDVVVVTERVITGELLAARVNGRKTVQLAKRAVLTPTARDYLRTHGIAITHEAAGSSSAVAGPKWRVLVSHAAPNVLQAIGDLRQQGLAVERELVGTTPEAARQAISLLSRAEVEGVLLVTSEPHVAACVANRNPRVRGAAVTDRAALTSVQSQLGPNLLCLSAVGKSYFELRNLLQACVATRPQVPEGWVN